MWPAKKIFSVAALHIHEKKEKFFPLLFVIDFRVAKRSHLKKKMNRSSFRLSRQDWSRLQRSTGWQNVVIVEEFFHVRFHRGNFFHWFAPRSKSAFALQVFSKKNIVKERTINRKRNVYTEKGMSGETTRRERRGRKAGGGEGREEKAWCPYIVWYAWVGGEMIKRDVRFDGCSLSPRIVRRCRCAFFTFPVPRSPFSELHAPNPTSDPHKGRRGRDTFGKSSATPLQRIGRVSQKSLVPRYVCFSDSLGSGAQAERETDRALACDRSRATM